MRQWIFATGLSLLAAPISSHAADLALSVDGVRSSRGNIMIAVYDAEAGFRDPTKAVARISLRAREGSMKVTLPDLPPATYAVAVFHDENGDQKLDTNILGIPIEGYGFSNDARGTMGPPNFRASAVEVGTGRVSVPMTLGY